MNAWLISRLVVDDKGLAVQLTVVRVVQHEVAPLRTLRASRWWPSLALGAHSNATSLLHLLTGAFRLVIALVLLRTSIVARPVTFLAASRAVRRSLLLADGGLALLESQRARRLERAATLLLILQL